ncbi:hypothetical protein G6F46_013575 [Rhizopus delemar]|nr:hypothetical protein G6F46_013575 [Rhizopus delemar]
MRLRIADGGRAQDELRLHAVERADALEPAQHVGDVAAEHAAVGVHFVDDDVAQVLEELRPLGVMRQDRLVQHVRVGDHDIAVQADSLARVAGGVAVEGEGFHPQIAGAVELQQLGHLVLGQCLGREQHSDLPLAVGVTMATCSPRWLASQASAWWLYSCSMPRAFSAAARAGGTASGIGA